MQVLFLQGAFDQEGTAGRAVPDCLLPEKWAAKQCRALLKEIFAVSYPNRAGIPEDTGSKQPERESQADRELTGSQD